jgi:hypothetical protein
MHWPLGNLRRSVACFALAAMLSSFWSAGCASSSSLLATLSNPFTYVGSSDNGTDSGSSSDDSSLFDGDGSGSTDPCSESLSRKFVRISMRNMAPSDYIHYFLVLIAYVNGEVYPDGAVCSDDIDLYTSFGYFEISEGTAREFGNYCIVGPALLYFHESGQFQQAGGTGGAQLASAIAPAQGTSPTYDDFFSSAGAQVPVPDVILFHNPGTGDGSSLKVSNSHPEPCAILEVGVSIDSDCDQDAFYYVDDFDMLSSGSTVLGFGSARRVPSEIQGTGCECLGFDEPVQQLAASRVTASNAQCNEFFRGGRIDYVFLREDTNPPFPQLVWRVTDAAGAVAHDFDARADVP